MILKQNPHLKKEGRISVSLIQLSTENLACLFRINKIGIPDELAKLLADPEVIKAGVAVHDDIRFLQEYKKFHPSGFIDLQNFVKDFGIQSSGLEKACSNNTGIQNIKTTAGYRLGSAEQLTEAQQVYAATDAWVCHQIYRKLMGR